MGNEHVTDKQLKNSVFTVFGVIQEIGQLFTNRKETENPQTDFVCGFLLWLKCYNVFDKSYRI